MIEGHRGRRCRRRPQDSVGIRRARDGRAGGAAEFRRGRDAPWQREPGVAIPGRVVGSTGEREELPTRRVVAARAARASGRCGIAQLWINAGALGRVRRTADLEAHGERQRHGRQARKHRLPASGARARRGRLGDVHAPCSVSPVGCGIGRFRRRRSGARSCGMRCGLHSSASQPNVPRCR